MGKQVMAQIAEGAETVEERGSFEERLEKGTGKRSKGHAWVSKSPDEGI